MIDILMIMMINVYNWKTNSLSEDTYEIGTISTQNQSLSTSLYRNYFVRK